MLSFSPLLTELDRITRRAGEIALESRRELKRRLKPDGSIVTNGDVAVERYLQPELRSLVKGSSVWGEEAGFEEADDNGWWLVDPIDGTTNYAFGGPYWGVSIALMAGDDLKLASIFLPDLNEILLAEAGCGSFLNGVPMKPIEPGKILDEEIVGYSDRVIKRCPGTVFPGRMRCSGAFVIDGGFTAIQRFRGNIGLNERLYDVAASVLINQELGADIRYADGDPFVPSDLAKDVKIAKPWVIFPKASGFFI